jgi:uncharacterized protein YjiS (DUF1127 family)
MVDAAACPNALPAGAALRLRRRAELLGRALCRVILARAARRALNELQDDLLEDMGLARSDILFLAEAFASRYGDPIHDAQNRLKEPLEERALRHPDCRRRLRP